MLTWPNRAPFGCDYSGSFIRQIWLSGLNLSAGARRPRPGDGAGRLLRDVRRVVGPGWASELCVHRLRFGLRDVRICR